MSKVRIIDSYEKDDNLIIRVKSISPNPLATTRSTFVVKPKSEVETKPEQLIGLELPGYIAFSERFTEEPVSSFNLIKRFDNDGNVALLTATRTADGVTGFLERSFRYHEEKVPDVRLNREEYSLSWETKPLDEWNTILGLEMRAPAIAETTEE